MRHRNYTDAHRHPLVMGKLPGSDVSIPWPITIVQFWTIAGTALLIYVIYRLLGRWLGGVDPSLLTALALLVVIGPTVAVRVWHPDGRDPFRHLASFKDGLIERWEARQ